MRLPIDSLVPEIVDHLRSSTNLVLEAPPGAGKTTRVPPALLELSEREVLVLEPRRLAARLAARFVAAGMGESVGGTVGYQVRFEDVAGPRTRLRFLTEGVLTRRLISDPTLERVSVVVLDEFHERHLEGDLALALLRRLQRTRRPDLRLVVMSATLDASPIARYLGDARVLRSEGRQYPLEIEYSPYSSSPQEQQVVGALERLSAQGLPGHVLVFLPGAAEIRRAQSACAPLAQRNGWLVLPLYGDQSAEEQDRAVAPSQHRKIILSTNVAESSVTIEGVSAVIDSGLARVAGHSAWSGLPTLEVARVSQASANQRAGRAGRTGPGRAVRLYPLEDFVRRPARDTPEVMRADLAPAALLLDAIGMGRLDSLEWLDAPLAAGVEQAEELLDLLGARGAAGREMARYPLHPRLGRLIVESRQRGVAVDGCTLAAVLSAGERLPARAGHATRSDLLVLLESEWEPRTDQLVRQVRRIVNPSRAGDARGAVGGGAHGVTADAGPRAAGVEARTRTDVAPGAAEAEAGRRTDVALGAAEAEADRRTGAEDAAQRAAGRAATGMRGVAEEDALLISVLAAFSDRVARRRQGSELQLAAGGPAQLAPSSTVSAAEFLVAVEAEDRRDQKMPLVRIASGIEPGWLLDLFPGRIRETTRVEWNRSAERVESVSALMFGETAIEESHGAPDPESASVMLAQKAREAGVARFASVEEVDAFLARVAFAAGHGSIPRPAPDAIDGALRRMAAGLKSFSELEAAGRDGGLIRAMEQELPAAARRLLDEIAPEHIRLPRGRRVRVNYEVHQPPWIASRLQDFFGMRETPAVARGAVRVVVRLLAPNHRPVQVTSDLTGFWERLYPQVRKELSRRYPKHSWPEDPYAR